mgnify:CR=1 FL=1
MLLLGGASPDTLFATEDFGSVDTKARYITLPSFTGGLTGGIFPMLPSQNRWQPQGYSYDLTWER